LFEANKIKSKEIHNEKLETKEMLKEDLRATLIQRDEIHHKVEHTGRLFTSLINEF